MSTGPFSVYLDLPIYDPSNFGDPSGVVGNALGYRHFPEKKEAYLSIGELVDPQIGKPAQKPDFRVAFVRMFFRKQRISRKSIFPTESLDSHKKSIFLVESKQMRDTIPSNFQVVAHPDLCSKAQW